MELKLILQHLRCVLWTNKTPCCARYSLEIHENNHCRDQCYEGDRVVDGVDDAGNVVHAAKVRIVKRAVVVARLLQAANIIRLVVPGAVERAISRGICYPERLSFGKINKLSDCPTADSTNGIYASDLLLINWFGWSSDKSTN
jgi:hypothetical protein